MNLQAAAALAKGRLADLFGSPRDLSLESFLYDDHLMVWSLTFGYAETAGKRVAKLVRVSEANQAVLSVADA